MIPLGERPRLHPAELQDLIESCNPGKHHVALAVGVRPSGAPLDLPVTIIRGRVDGPRGAVLSGVHGDEAPGPEGARRFASEIDHQVLAGTVVVCPLVNIGGFEHRSRTSQWDGVDLVRIWPGDSGGTLTHQTAETVVAGIVEGSSFVVDLHSGTPLIHEDWVIYANPHSPSPNITEAVAAKSQAMAVSFGTGQIIRRHPWRTTISGLADLGMPTILAEIGGGPDCHRHLGDYLETMVRGLNNVLGVWGMLDEQSLAGQDELCIEYDVIEEILAPDGSGLWMRRIGAGDEVVPGTVVGVLIDPITGAERPIAASVSGVILKAMVTWPHVAAGQWLLAVGDEVAIHQRGA